jgi:hypothetical protein
MFRFFKEVLSGVDAVTYLLSNGTQNNQRGGSTMWKKIVALFRHPAVEKPYIQPKPVKCYQLELPFE